MKVTVAELFRKRKKIMADLSRGDVFCLCKGGEIFMVVTGLGVNSMAAVSLSSGIVKGFSDREAVLDVDYDFFVDYK